MVNFLDNQSDAKRFAALLADYDRRLRDLERTSKAAYTSIEGGTLDIYTEDGQLAGSVGMQPDGGIALVPEPAAATAPPTPGAPTVAPALSGLVVTWDGWWDDSNAPPTDFAAMQVHVGTTADFTPDFTTLTAAITDVTGGSVTLAVDGYTERWVRLVALNTAGLLSAPSVAVSGTARQAVEQDLVDGMVTEVKLAENAVTQAKIALGAVGSAALADGAVLEEKLAKAAVTLGKIADGAVTINALGGALSDSAAQRYVDAMGDPAAWTVTDKSTGATWEHLSGITDAPTGQTVGRATGYTRLLGTTVIPYEPGVLYRLSARIRMTSSTGTSDAFYVGVAGIGADGKTLVNRAGTHDSPNSHYYIAASGKPITAADGWVQVIGFISGRAAAGATGSAGPNNDPRAPGLAHADVRYIAPYLWLNYNSQSGAQTSVMEVDCVTLEALKTGVVDSINIVAGAVTAAAIATDAVTAGKIAADAISARELKAGSVTASELAAGAVTAQAVAAGAITAEKLTIVGSPNILPDPSFEGAGGAAIAAKQTFLTQDTTFGNGSKASLKIDATSAAAAYRAAELTMLPVTPGDQLYLATDYYPSTDWAGAEISMQVRWEAADGTIVDYSKLANTTPVRGMWARFAGAVTAPADAVQGRVRVESGNATAGAVWFDNAAVRPVVPGVQIADGAITAPKILAGSITTDKLTALSVTAEKIASLAITTDKLSALSVTADKLAVNSVTASKILAGSIDATHIKAGAISADRLALGTDGNVIADPSFEGATSDQRIAGNTDWSFVAGNGTARALQVSAVSATPLNRVIVLATLPAVPGQKVWLSVDYLASTDWAGSHFGLYGQWFDASGTLLGYSSLSLAGDVAVRGTWTSVSAVPAEAAPTGTTRLRVVMGSVSGTAGTVAFDNVACRVVLASGFAGARAEISPSGLQLYDDAGQEAVALVTGRPNYLTLSSGGVPVATIDQEGAAGFQRLAVAEGLTVGGTDWGEYLNQYARGIQAIDYQASTVTASASELGYVELATDIDASRMYRVVFEARANPSVAGGELQLRLRGGGTGAPTITSPQLHIAVWPMAMGNSFTCRLEHIFSGKSLGSGNRRFLITFVNALGPTGQTIDMYGASTSLGKFYIEDIGPYIPETGQYNTGGGTTAPPVQKYTKTYAASWSGSYANRGSYNSYYGNRCLQGYYSSTNGVQAALIGFPSALASDLSGAAILKAEVYLYFEHWYSNAGGKAVIKAHKHTSRPSTFSSDSESQTISWKRNEGKWVDITAVFDSTSWRGIALDPNSTSSTYYGIARGVGQANPPQLRVTFTK
ncbi:hypothetical protein GTY75_08665 [Streptomyces sp. SID8381]|uniref:hypothetical protein n=1 Tax=unclassified Streptomyces TaxID=2593676 RepID=UPI000374C33F|nr:MULTISPECIES: hypothetical protein [unclassified Streptomyces]MYX26740.1 hypothetical protein [Streptomyces sp. SID8381]